jgi:membrane-bound metal-dependent hydrolase YbcI (DUF457 family)
MFIGHIAAGLVGSRVEPRLRLADAIVAAQLPDVLWPVLVLAGVERFTIAPGDTVVTPLRFDSYPWSHSLLMIAVWGALGGWLYSRGRGGARVALLCLGLAESHWLLDFVTHRPDMPLYPGGGPRLGLGLWNSRPLTMLVEFSMYAAATWYYTRGRKPSWSFFSLIGVFAVVYVVNLFGPPPPSVNAVAVSALLIVPIAWLWARRAEVL